MCGIVGVVHRDRNLPVPESVVRRMCAAIRHRGPDDEGVHVSGAVGLGMRRLSIIDLAGSRQPVFNEDRSRILIFNGEIYNYRDLRRELDGRGHSFNTGGDAETIVHLHEERGKDCVTPLRGMFALALWDTEAERLLLARDRFGIKPLYYVVAPWGIAFASELKALLAARVTTAELDWSAIDMYFQTGYIPAPRSPFLDVKKVPPGCVLEWEAAGATVTRYWDLPRDRHPAPADVERHVLEWLDDSVTAHLVADVPVAAFLSGGFDSSAVVASMAEQGETPHAFTARYHGSGAEAADETGLARELSDRYGAKLTVVDVNPDVREIFEPVVTALDEPHADESAIPSWLISEAVAAEYKVALVGTGGDELFAGYRRHIGLLAGGLYGRFPRWAQRTVSAVADRIPEPRDSSLAIDRVKRFLRSAEGTEVDRLLGYVSKLADGSRLGLYAESIRDSVARTAAREHWSGLHQEGGSPRGLQAALYLDYKTYLPDDLLALSDRMSMAHSLEIRVPFVDHRLIEAVFPLSDRIKVGPWRNKRLLKRALRSRLPRAHYDAPKRGFVGPTAAWLKHELRDVLTDELSPTRLDRLGLFNSATVAGLVDDHLSRRHNREGILWALLCFLTWHRVTVEGYAGAAYPCD